MAKILMIISGADTLTLADGTTHPTGYWAEEVAASHKLLRDAGVRVDIATPGGARPTVDAISLDERGGVAEADSKEFRAYLDSIDGELARPLALAEVSPDDYDAVYLPGGHAPMADLVENPDLGRLLNTVNAQDKIVVALCHGLAGLLSATGSDGGFTFAGRSLTSFTDEEERRGGLGDEAPFFVESRLRDRGAVIDVGPAWSSKVVKDGNLITGQNPQSSTETAQRALEALRNLR